MRKYYKLKDLLPIYKERDCFNVYLDRYKVKTNFILAKETNLYKTRLATLDEWERIIREMYNKTIPASRTIRRILTEMYINLLKIREEQEIETTKNNH